MSSQDKTEKKALQNHFSSAVMTIVCKSMIHFQYFGSNMCDRINQLLATSLSSSYTFSQAVTFTLNYCFETLEPIMPRP